MCDQCHHHEAESNSSGFVFGIVLGAIIGAIIAIYFYKNDKGQVFDNLKEKLGSYFKKFVPASKPSPTLHRPHKISVTIPKNIETVNLSPARTPKPKKMFVKK